MKTLLSHISGNVRSGASLLGVAALFFYGQAAFAQKAENSRLAHYPDGVAAQEIMTSAPGKLRAAVFPSGNPLKVKVSFENPARERIMLTIKNDAGAVVHSSSMGHGKTYVGLLDISALRDGDYTVLLESKSGRYAHSFELRTETARLAIVQ